MELKNLLSVVIAALTALGAMLFAMGSQSAWLAMALWMAAVVSRAASGRRLLERGERPRG